VAYGARPDPVTRTVLEHAQPHGPVTLPDAITMMSRNETPVVFMSATPALLAGIESWVGALERVSLTNSLDDAGSVTPISTGVTAQDFATFPECINYMLETIGQHSPASPGQTVCVVADPGVVNGDFAKAAGFVLAQPSAGHADTWTEQVMLKLLAEGKLVSTMCDLGDVEDYAAFRQACVPHGLKLAVDVTLADDVSGRAAVEIASQEDWDAQELHFAGHRLIGRRPVSSQRYSIEILVTSSGFVHAPLTETRFERFWHIRDWVAVTIDADQTRDKQAAVLPRIKKIAERLSAAGYRGAASIELCDDGNGFAVNRVIPRLSHNSLLAHVVTSLHGGFPIHLLHMAACLDPGQAVELDKLQQRYGLHDTWSVIAIRHSGSQTEMITRAPASGLYRMADHTLELVRTASNWMDAMGHSGYFLRLQNAGNYRMPGTLLGLLYLRREVLKTDGEWTPEAAQWIAALQVEYAGLGISGSSLPAAMTNSRREDFL
jgi:hypothetical protein